MDNISLAYTANKKIEGELRQRERILEKQQLKMMNKIEREKSELFDTLIHLNVRTPHPETKSTDHEIVRLNKVELDSKTVAPKSLGHVLGKRQRKRPKYVTPVIDHKDGDVYCEIEEDRDTRLKLEMNTRTSSHLYKTLNIARCLEALNGRGNKMADDVPAAGAGGGRKEAVERLTRSRTFIENRQDRIIPFYRSKTSIDIQYADRPRVSPSTAARNCNRAGTSKLCRESGASSDMVQSSTTSHGSEKTASGSSCKDVSQPSEFPLLYSFQHWTYFNLRCIKLRREREVQHPRRPARTRQSLLKGYVPLRGAPGDTGGRGREKEGHN